MDNNAIKKYAVWARTELITRVSQRAEKYDITAEADVNARRISSPYSRPCPRRAGTRKSRRSRRRLIR